MYKLLAPVMLLLAVPFVSGQQNFSLEDAKQYAYANHKRLTNAKLSVDNATQQMKETTAIGLPQVNMSGSFNHFINLPVQVVDASFFNPMAPEGETISFRAGTTYNASGTFQATQMVFNGSYIVGLQVAKLFVGFQESLSEQTEEDIIFNVIQAYQYCAVAKENLQFIDSMVLITEELLDKQKNYFELELIIKEDIDQLEYALLSTKNAQTNANIQYENALAMLKMTMNYPMDQGIQLSDDVNKLMLANATVNSGSIRNNMNYQLLEKQIVLSGYNVKNNRMAYLPTLNAFFQQTYNAYRNEFNLFADEKWFPQTLWGLQLNVPIFSSGARSAKVAQSRIKLMQEENNLLILEESLKFQELQLKNNLISAQQRLELQTQNVKIAKSIYTNSVTREQIGKENSIIVTQKYNQYLIAQSEYVASLIDLFQAKLNLDKLYNQITENKK
jgi:outer membrane protein TolC